MRQLPLFILLALALSLGGCASSTSAGVCAGVSGLNPRQEFAPSLYRERSVRPSRMSYHEPSHKASVLPKLTKNDTPEPRPTSTEWWTRENARLGRATIICRGCLPVPVATVSLPKPAILSSESNLEAIPTSSIPSSSLPSTSRERVETPAP